MPVMTFLPSVAASSTASNWSSASIGVTLTQASAMGHQGTVDGGVAGTSPGQPLEWIRIVVEPEGRPAALQLAAAEGRGRRRPDRSVPCDLLRMQIRAERDQLGEVADRLDAADLFYAHEAVRIQVVPEQQGRVLVFRREEA